MSAAVPVSLLGRLSLLLCLTFVVWPIVQVSAAQRAIELTPGVDYFGRDYATLKSVTLDECQAACLNDSRCRAFTYNTKAEWCFLKESHEDARPFAGAVSGYVVEGGDQVASRPVAPAVRLAELGFLPPRELGDARRLAARLASAPEPETQLATLISQSRSALQSKQPAQAADLQSQALRLAPDDRGLWAALAESSLAAAQSGDWDDRQRYRQQATAAAINAHARAQDGTERAAALALIARTLAQRNEWRAAIKANRAALALVDSPELRQLLDQQIAEHGFRVTEHEVESDAASPRICIQFSDPLDLRHPNLTDFVRVVARTDLPIEAESKQLCIDGVRHGERYQVLVRPGLPAADGEMLSKGSELDIYVRDRAPMARFLGRAYVLPKGGEAAIPVVSVNTDTLEAEVHRLGDRVLTQALEEGLLEQQLGRWSLERIQERTGESIWKGTIEVKPELNREVTTAVPVGALVSELKPGIHVLTVRPRNAPDEGDSLATQWFLVSDLGLTTLAGNDGLHTLVRSLSSAQPLGRVEVRLVAVNNEILGRAVTDKDGHARFDPGLLRGTGGNAPALLVAESTAGDYAFLDLTQSPFDLSDRGVDGRLPPKPLDVYLVSERGAYRPGETVHLTALVRDSRARAVTDLPITLIVKRPDGMEYLRTLTQDQGQGGHAADVQLTRTAPRGTWRAAVHADPKGPALAELAFLVEDFLPERLTFELDSSSPAIDPADPPSLRLDAQFLYGAPAGGLALEGEIQLQPTDTLTAFPGYRFGLASEELEPLGAPLSGGRTDAAGHAEVSLDLPEIPPTTKLLEADIQVRVLEEGGRPVERRLKRPVASKQTRIGLKPLFEGSVEEGGNARFEAIAIGADGRRQSLAGVRWTLARLKTSFQWYASDGNWNYEPITTTERVADGTLDLDVLDAGRIEAAVDWGRYRLTLATSDSAVLPVDLEFEAGWYVQPKTQDTPDLLKVSLDKPSYRVGDKARVRLEPRFAGLALVMVVDDRLIGMKAVEVPETARPSNCP
jgi:alpha-2-macroglobulin